MSRLLPLCTLPSPYGLLLKLAPVVPLLHPQLQPLAHFAACKVAGRPLPSTWQHAGAGRAAADPRGPRGTCDGRQCGPHDVHTPGGKGSAALQASSPHGPTGESAPAIPWALLAGKLFWVHEGCSLQTQVARPGHHVSRYHGCTSRSLPAQGFDSLLHAWHSGPTRKLAVLQAQRSMWVGVDMQVSC